jgi:hypothetical protein
VVYLGSEQDIKVLQNHGCKEYTDFADGINTNKIKKKDQTKTYFLFGKILDKEHVRAPEGSKPYAEARIARILYYPPTDKPEPATRVGIEVTEYIDSKSGQIFAYRFQSLQAMD